MLPLLSRLFSFCMKMKLKLVFQRSSGISLACLRVAFACFMCVLFSLCKCFPPLYCTRDELNSCVIVPTHFRYERATGEQLASLSGHTGAISAMCFCGGSVLCTAGWDRVVVAWDLPKQAERWSTRANDFDRRVNVLAVSREKKN